MIDSNLALRLLSLSTKNICINVESFTDILKDYGFDGKFEPITDRKVLMTGHYGNIIGMKIFVSKMIEPAHFRTSDLENVDNLTLKNEADWSLEISFEDYLKENQHRIILS